jgi:hypothetical protein
MKNVTYYQRGRGGAIEALPAVITKDRSERVKDLRVLPVGRAAFAVQSAQRLQGTVPTHGYYAETEVGGQTSEGDDAPPELTPGALVDAAPRRVSDAP